MNMKRARALKLIRTHKAEFSPLGVKSLAIFGSTARDEATSQSDVDILVDFVGPATFDRYMDLKFLLEEILGQPVDLVTRQALKPRLIPQIEKEAVYVA